MLYDHDYYSKLYNDTGTMLRRSAPALFLPFLLLLIPTILAIMITFGAFLLFSGYLNALFEAYLYDRELSRVAYLRALNAAVAKANSKRHVEASTDIGASLIPNDDYSIVMRALTEPLESSDNLKANKPTKSNVYALADTNDLDELTTLIDSNIHHMYINDVKSFITNSDIKLSKVLLVSLVKRLLVLLGLVCLIIPGIILVFNFSMANYIAITQPDIKSPMAILRMSSAMMKGHRWHYLKLTSCYIVPILMIILSLGILTPWCLPFIKMLKARFYFDLSHPMGIEPPPYYI